MSFTTYAKAAGNVALATGLIISGDWKRWLAAPDRRTPDKIRAHASQVTWPTVRAGRGEAAKAARSFYDEERQRQVGSVNDFDLFDHASLDVLLRDIFAEVDETDLSDDDDSRGLATRIGQVAIEEVSRAGRQQTAGMIKNDPACQRWARVDLASPSCALCLTLISRGPVYLTDETASFRSHKNCTCSSVPVFDPDDYPGRSQWKDAEKLFVRASKDAKGTDLDAIQTLRKQLEGN